MENNKYKNEPALRKAYVDGVWCAIEEMAISGAKYASILECVIGEAELTPEECSIQLEQSKSTLLPDLKEVYDVIEMAVEYAFN